MIEYLAPSSGGGGLQINYIETNLTGSDFTKLNTVPLTIVPVVPDSYIIPIVFQIGYQVNIIQFDGIAIANQAAYGGTVNQSAYFLFNKIDLEGYSGSILFPASNISLIANTISYTQYNENTQQGSPIVLCAPSDSLNDFSFLKIRVWYYTAPIL